MADPGAARFEASLAYLRERFVALRPAGGVAALFTEQWVGVPGLPPAEWEGPTVKELTGGLCRTVEHEDGTTAHGCSAWGTLWLRGATTTVNGFQSIAEDARAAIPGLQTRVGVHEWGEEDWPEMAGETGFLWAWFVGNAALQGIQGCLLESDVVKRYRSGRPYWWTVRDLVEGSIMLIDAALAAPSPPPSPTPPAGRPEATPPRRGGRVDTVPERLKELWNDPEGRRRILEAGSAGRIAKLVPCGKTSVVEAGKIWTEIQAQLKSFRSLERYHRRESEDRERE